MAYVVARPGTRWEIRESVTTPNGPRARTLATFTALSDEVISRAAAAARTPFDAAAVLRAARRAGVPAEKRPADALAARLLRSAARGVRPRPGLTRLLLEVLSPKTREIDDALAEWVDASMEERAAALVDLLGLADSLPRKRAGDLKFPGLSRAQLRDDD